MPRILREPESQEILFERGLMKRTKVFLSIRTSYSSFRGIRSLEVLTRGAFIRICALFEGGAMAA